MTDETKKKIGLDDYLIKYNKDGFEQLQKTAFVVDFFFQKKDGTLITVIDGTKYQIYSYKKEPSGFKVTISIIDPKNREPIYKDSLPLWSAKKRKEFANKYKDKGFTEIERHLTVIEEQIKRYVPMDNSKIEKQEQAEKLLSVKTSLFDIHRVLGESMSSPWIHDVIEIAIATSINMPLLEKSKDNGLLWVLIIGNPSSYKTESVLHLSGTPYCYFLDSLTANSFVSGYVDVTGEKAKDLLPELKGKFLIIKDYTTLFSLNEDLIKKVLGDLQSIYDGDYSKYTGTVGNITYKDIKFSHIGCITPLVVSKRHTFMSMLGSRFLFYRIPELKNEEIDAGCEILWEGNRGRQNELTKICSAHSYQLYKAIPNIEIQAETKDQKKKLNTLAKLLARGRGVIVGETTQYYDKSDSIKSKPKLSYSMKEMQVEEPFRALNQLRTLSRALAIVHGRKMITDHEIEIIRRVVVSSMPIDRSKVLTLLIKDKQITRMSCKEALDKSYSTAVELLEELVHLKILKKCKNEQLDYHKTGGILYEVEDEFLTVLSDSIEPLDHICDIVANDAT